MSTATSHKRKIQFEDRSRNPFLDLEASVSHEDSEGEDEDLSMFDDLDENEREADAVASHSYLHHAMLQSRQNNDVQWHSLVDRARERSNLRDATILEISEHPLTDVILDSMKTQPGGVGEDYNLSPQDFLAEISCWVGHEEIAAFKVMQIATNPSSPNILCRSVIGRSSIPGRIYAEVATINSARKLVESVRELTGTVLRRLSSEECVQVLKPRSNHIGSRHWVRVRGTGKWKAQRGQIGLVHNHDSGTVVVLASEDQGTGDGFIVIKLDKIEVIIRDGIMPTSTEWEQFRRCSFLDAKVIKDTQQALVRSRLKHGDRVKITAGDYIGLLGTIVEESSEDEVAVYLDTQDVTTQIIRHNVRAEYRVGDVVRIVEGESKGLTGWVVEIEAGMLRVTNPGSQVEVIARRRDVEFYNNCVQDAGLRPRKRHKESLGDRDPNDIYIGKRVLVVGLHSEKGYRGLIKRTHPDGYADVEIEARQQQIQRFKIRELIVLQQIDLQSPPVERPGTPTDPITLETVLSPAWDPSSRTPIERPGTPTGPMPLETVLSPAWDPSSRTPIPAASVPPAWDPSSITAVPVPEMDIDSLWLMTDIRLHSLRIKLITREEGHQGPLMELVEIRGTHARVRLGSRYIDKDPASLLPLYPCDINDLVTPLQGPMVGQLFKIRLIEGPTCTVQKVAGKRLSKKETHPTFPTSSLIQIYAPFR